MQTELKQEPKFNTTTNFNVTLGNTSTPSTNVMDYSIKNNKVTLNMLLNDSSFNELKQASHASIKLLDNKGTAYGMLDMTLVNFNLNDIDIKSNAMSESFGFVTHSTFNITSEIDQITYKPTVTTCK